MVIGDAGTAGAAQLPARAAAPTDLAGTALALARRFASGATLWCVAPQWPAHARHLAVEFVHPVVVGARALPGVAVEGDDPVGSVRSLSTPGDLLAAIGPADDACLAALLPRARAWGLTTLGIGAGPRPAPGWADHLVWTDAPARAVAHDGRLVLAYHLLWELTHVCFEHPGLLVDPDGCEDEQVCATCSDEGRHGEVFAVGPAVAEVRTAAGRERVDCTLVGPVQPGDVVLIHAGVAISRVDVAPLVHGGGPV
ncbi:MAG TPA: HypC/HybG/HupF family hydrogenase formation chaperone [Acidimicrobiales bacterium]|nr:HypC/HybG/HupF family hydrogenase formation chaperone [Acidimicrobiales bacterium]